MHTRERRLNGKALLAGAAIFSLIACFGITAETRIVQPLPLPASPAKVAIIKDAQQNVKQMVSDAVTGVLGPAGMAALVKTGDVVLLKPNLVASAAVAGAKSMTDYRIAQATADLAKAAGAATVIIAEGSALNNTAAMRDSAGYTAANFPGVQFLDLDDVTNNAPVTMHLLDGCVGDDKIVAAAYVNANVVISMPIMKTHQGAGVSGSLKNAFGIAPQPLVAFNGSANKELLHADIRKNIVDYNLCRKPDFAIMDGLVGMEGNGPTNGTPVTMNLILAGKDLVALDAVECSVMDVPPYEISSLVLASNANLGVLDLDKISVVGESVANVRRSFVRAQSELGYYNYRATTAVRKTSAPIFIDGTLSEWSGRNIIRANAKAQVIGDTSKWSGPADCSFFAKFLYDSANLYMAVAVRDPEKNLNAGTGAAIANGECVELYLSTNIQFGDNMANASDNRPASFSASYDYHIGFSHAPTPANWIFSHNASLVNAVAKSVDNDTGYTMEVKIPWSNFNNFTMSRYHELGINVAVSDADHSATGIDYKIAWEPNQAIDTDATKMGLAYLAPQLDDSASGISGNAGLRGKFSATAVFGRAVLDPLRHTVRIFCEVPDRIVGAAVGIDIFNVKGGRTKTLSDETHGKGPHYIIWDCTDDNGHRVSPGIFFCRLHQKDHGISISSGISPVAVY